MKPPAENSGSGRDPLARYRFGIHVVWTEDDEGATVWTAPLPPKQNGSSGESLSAPPDSAGDSRPKE
jgi:hypothetical protein